MQSQTMKGKTHVMFVYTLFAAKQNLFPSNMQDWGKGNSEVSCKQGESLGAVVPIISSLKYLKWSFCLHYVECWLFILERINIYKGLHRFTSDHTLYQALNLKTADTTELYSMSF